MTTARAERPSGLSQMMEEEISRLEIEASSGSTRARARARTRLALLTDGYKKNGRSITHSEEWLETLQRTDVGDDSERGEAVLSAASAIRNVKSANIADFLRWLLDSGAWRSYTYPNGDHYEFREREFDYFCAQIDLDPKIANEAARVVQDPALLVAMTEASLVGQGWNPHDVERKPLPQGGRAPAPDRSKRRSIDEITATYPGLRPWLDKYGYARTLGGTNLHQSATVRAKVAKGATIGEAKRSRKFQVDAYGDADLATRIAEKLTADGLAEDVYRILAADRARQMRSTRKASK